MQHQRAHIRYPVVPSLLVTQGTQQQEEFGQLLNLSERGLLLARAEAVESGSAWDLVVHCAQPVHGRECVRLAGQVRWCLPGGSEGRFDCGVQIKTIDRRDAEALGDLVNAVAMRAGS